MNKKRKQLVRLICLILAGVLLLSVISGALIIMANAATSKEIEKELEALRNEAAELKKQAQEVQDNIDENRKGAQTLVEKKRDIDQQMEMSRQAINNLNAQIQQYSLLIAEKQTELENSIAEEDKLNAQYKIRIRTMEETGNISYWSILFGASSFSDLLSKVDMISEVAKSDQLMLKKLAAITETIEQEQTELEQEMANLEAAKQELSVQQEELEAQRAENDELLLQMEQAYATLSEDYQNYMDLEDALSEQIAKSETDYFNALAQEEAARQAELARKQAEEAAKQRREASTGGNVTATESGFVYPLPSRVSITDAYGYRTHPLTGEYKWHNGVDFAAGAGAAIYATKSGTVTSSCYNEAYGNMVTINHGDGYSSLYGHMDYATVSAGDYVKQGEIIGYVGSTGWSTGPHLHFTIYYNGADVNPMNYV